MAGKIEKPAKVVYVVMGTCGSCEDRQEWNVKGFMDWEMAEAFRVECLTASEKHHITYRHSYGREPYVGPDSRFSYDYEVTDYSIDTLELI